MLAALTIAMAVDASTLEEGRREPKGITVEDIAKVQGDVSTPCVLIAISFNRVISISLLLAIIFKNRFLLH